MISVIIPAYNAEKYLAATVQSLQAQTLTAWELIIVDDGSKDNSLAIAEDLRRQDDRISVLTQLNAGVSAARNFGLAKSVAAYPYALCLDSDDLLVPGALQTLLTLLEAWPEAPAACGFLQDINADGRIITGYHRIEPLIPRRGVDGFRLVRRQPDAPLVFGDLCFRNHIITPGQVLIRKNVLPTSGAFDASLSYTADYDLWWRLVMQFGPIAVTPEPVLLYRHHSASMSGNRAGRRRDAAAWRRNLLTNPGMSPQQKQVARAGYFYSCAVRWEFALLHLRSGKVKQGLKEGGVGMLDMLYFARDLVRLRKQAATPRSSVSH